MFGTRIADMKRATRTLCYCFIFLVAGGCSQDAGSGDAGRGDIGEQDTGPDGVVWSTEACGDAPFWGRCDENTYSWCDYFTKTLQQRDCPEEATRQVIQPLVTEDLQSGCVGTHQEIVFVLSELVRNGPHIIRFVPFA